MRPHDWIKLCCQMAEDSLHTLEVPPPDPSTPRRVFLEVSLKDGLFPMMPHSMYCLPLWPGITLVLLTKVCGNQKCYLHPHFQAQFTLSQSSWYSLIYLFINFSIYYFLY